MNRNKRLQELMKVPAVAALDAHMLHDETGVNPAYRHLKRSERRKLSAKAKKLAERYARHMENLLKSGSRYPVDQLIRQLAIEYNHRYASSGLMTQPVSFNYFEPFCQIRLFPETFAPYVSISPETDHLFSIPDFFDFITSRNADGLSLKNLYDLPEGETHNFTQNGDIHDFTYLTPGGREFYVSGFSIIRHGDSINWFVLGGELMSEEEWKEISDSIPQVDFSNVSPFKQRFLRDNASLEDGPGAPLPLEGTERAIRTIFAGETDLRTEKHLERCYMTEHTNTFSVVSDDPDVFRFEGEKNRDEIIYSMMERIEAASVMWSLAEGFFHLFSYFKFRLTVAEAAEQEKKPRKPKVPSTKMGVGGRFNYVKALEFSSKPSHVMMSYTPPRLPVETEGFWRRLPNRGWGVDRLGAPVQGRTWVNASNEWRERRDLHKTIYIKSTIQAAQTQIIDYLNASSQIAKRSQAGKENVLYVLRCVLMKDEIYKVGWTSGTADQRAKELSSATGVPSAFVVVADWYHENAGELEVSVHAALAPYRLNASREFFQVNYETLKKIIEAQIARSRNFQSI